MEKFNHRSKTISKSRGNTLSSIVGSYKSAVTRHARRLGYEFGWQSRFYDHVIRDQDAFDSIAKYFQENPKKWSEDRFNR